MNQWALLLHDIDMLIDPGEEMDMQAVRKRLTEVNERIVVIGMKLYFIHVRMSPCRNTRDELSDG